MWAIWISFGTFKVGDSAGYFLFRIIILNDFVVVLAGNVIVTRVCHIETVARQQFLDDVLVTVDVLLNPFFGFVRQSIGIPLFDVSLMNP